MSNPKRNLNVVLLQIRAFIVVKSILKLRIKQRQPCYELYSLLYTEQ